MRLTRVYFGSTLEPNPIGDKISFDEVCMNFGTEDNKKLMNFVREPITNSLIKIPNSVQPITMPDMDIGFASSTIMDCVDVTILSTIMDANGKRIRDDDVKIGLNPYGLSPYLTYKSKRDKHNYVYCYVVLNTNDFHLLEYDNKMKNIISTNRDINKGYISCLIELKKNKPFTIYMKDLKENKICKAVIELNKENILNVSPTYEIQKAYLHRLFNIANKNKSKIFRYNYKFMPKAKITHRDDKGSEFVQVSTKEDAGSSTAFIKGIRKGLESSFGRMPKAILLASDVDDLEYKDMIALRFQYVLRENEDGTIETVKSN